MTEPLSNEEHDRLKAEGVAWCNEQTFARLIAQARRTPPTTQGGEGDYVLMPRDPGSCEGDDSAPLLAFIHELHAHLPEDQRPTSWMQFFDDQRQRIQNAYRAMLSAAPPAPASDHVGEGEVDPGIFAIPTHSYAPDHAALVGEVEALRGAIQYAIETRGSGGLACAHKHPAPDEFCARCRLDAALHPSAEGKAS